jgi:hypothetical protein
MDRQATQPHGMSRDRLARVERFIDDAYIATGKLPGALTQVWRRSDRCRWPRMRSSASIR